jgi:hypothetical protein
MGDYDLAARLRDTVTKIVDERIKKVHPAPRIGTVQHIDSSTNQVQVQFPGDETLLKVNTTPGNQPRYAADDLSNNLVDAVRIGGRPGNYYIMDVLTSSAKNVLYEAQGTTPAPLVSPVPTILPGPGAAIVDWTPSVGLVYDVYASTTTPIIDSTMLLPEGNGVLPPLWVRNLPNGSPLPTTVDPDTGQIVPQPVNYAIVARSGQGVAPPSGWVSGAAGFVNPDYLLLTVDKLLANGLFAAAAKLVTLVVSGDFTANTMTAVGKVALRAVDNELGPGAKLILQKGTTAPATPPTVSNDVPWVAADDTAGTYYAGGYCDGSDLYCSFSTTSGGFPVLLKQPLAGGDATTLGPFFTGNESGFTVTKIGSNWYLLYSKTISSVVHWFIQKYDLSFATVGAAVDIGTTTITNAVLGNDGTNLIVAYKRGTATAGVSVKTFDASTLALIGSAVDLKQANGTTDYAPGSGIYLRSAHKGNFDYGSSRIVLFVEGLQVQPVFTAAGVYSTGDTWSTPSGVQHINGSAWDPTAGQFVHLDLNVSKLYKYTKDIWSAGDYHANRYISHTWQAAGPVETDQGPRAYLDSNKRWRTTLSGLTIPLGSLGFRAYMSYVPDATGDVTTDQIATGTENHGLSVNDPIVIVDRGTVTGITNGTTYYVQSVPGPTAFKIAATVGGAAINLTGTTGTIRYSPPRTQMWRVLDLADGSTSAVIPAPVVLGSPSANPPATNGYGAGTPAEVLSNATDTAGPIIDLFADGSGRAGPLKWGTDGKPVTTRYVMANRGATLSLPNATDTYVAYDTEEEDPANILATAGGISTFTIPEAGVWRFAGMIGFAANATGRRYAGLSLNDGGSNPGSSR